MAPAHGVAPAAVDDALGASAIDGAAAAGAPENYIIQVASFEGRTRSGRLVEELTIAGFRAREVQLDLGPPRGRLWQVIVGGYSSALEVQRDLQRIREMPGYKDARLLDR
jgi:cell division septation protein DedD